MSVVGDKRGLDVDAALDVQKMCSFKTDNTVVGLVGVCPDPTIMTKNRLLCVQEKDGALPEAYTCTTLVGYADSKLLTYDQEDGPFNRATFVFCVGIACLHPMMYVLEKNPAVVRAVNTKTKTVTTLKLDVEPIEGAVCLECGPGNKLYICTQSEIYVAHFTSDKCRRFATDVKFEKIEALCMDYAQNRLCVADNGRVKFLSLKNTPETEVMEVQIAKKDETATAISSLKCDRAGNLLVTQNKSDKLVRIHINGQMTVQRVMYAENGIEDMALSASGELWFIAFEGIDTRTEKVKYNVLRAKDHLQEPSYMADVDLPFKRRTLESRIADNLRRQQREELQRDLLHGTCIVKLDDDSTEAMIKVNINVCRLAATFDFFAAFQRFPGNSDTVRLDGISGEVFRDMLEFCYTGTLEQKRHEMHKMEFLVPRIAAANMLGCKFLLEYLELAFVEAVTHQNALEMLALAETLPVQSLVKRMREYVEANSKAIACMSGGAHAEKLSHESLHALVKCMCGHLARSV